MRYLILAILLSACSANGPAYHSVKNDSNLIVYRPNSIKFYGRLPDVTIGDKKCELPNGSFIAVRSDKDKQPITADLWDIPGTSYLLANAQKGKKSYVKISVSGEKMWLGILGGAAGQHIAEGSSAYSGPFIIQQMDAATAERELSDLKMVDNCP